MKSKLKPKISKNAKSQATDKIQKAKPSNITKLSETVLEDMMEFDDAKSFMTDDTVLFMKLNDKQSENRIGRQQIQ